ncbi:MAG: CoA transferase [Acidimicrobiales bacterium]|nr:MAG: CoA transferase [Acidimicrobiales bacterium]
MPDNGPVGPVHKGALSGVRVLDLSRVLAGPACAQLLADLGADVIKVERPGMGDDTRQWGPPWLQAEDGTETRESSYYLSANRGKRSVAIDIGTPEGVQLIKDLAAVSDIIVENFKVGALAKKGLGYDDIRAVKPDIIYTSITGFGQDGPMAEQPGYDYLAQAMGGMMSVTGRADGEPGAGPLRAGTAIADQASGMYATVGTLAALHHRDQTGEGQHIDVALLDSQLAFMINQGLNYLISGTPPTRSGEWHPNLAPYQPFDVADGRVIIAVGNNGQFASLMGWLELGHLVDDPRFANNPDRNQHRVELAGLIQEQMRTKSKAEALEALPRIGVPAATVNNLAEAFADPQIQHRGGRIDLPHAAGSAPGIANPLHLSASPVTYRNAPPTLGEHTDDVLSELLGLTPDALQSLHEAEIID